MLIGRCGERGVTASYFEDKAPSPVLRALTVAESPVGTGTGCSSYLPASDGAM